jgi:pimeloyl-ACP methyl ester carboxylesterase
MSQRPLVIFIHGTWSNFKIWDWMEGKLRTQFPDKFDFDRLKWSGGNSAFARAEGVKNFETLATAKPDCPLFIISHSHGANIVLQSSDPVRNRVQLLICLNSPILNAKRFKLPLPVSIALLVLSLIAGVAAAAWNFGAWSGLWGETQNYQPGLSPVALLGVIALAAILFCIANTRGAFLLLGVFALFAVLMTAALIDSYSFFADSWMFHGLFFGSMVAYEIFIGGVALLLPALTTYGFWTRWRFKYNLHPYPISRIVHVVSIDDEIFLLLGLSLAVQRLSQLLLGPIFGSFEKVKMAWFVWFISMPVAITGIVAGFWHGAASLHDKLNYLSRFIIFPLTIAALFAAIIIYLRIALFGIAYGWDIAGLSVDHAIYISQGSVANPTEVYTLEPQAASIWVSHVKIHNSPEALKLVEKTLRETLHAQ